MAFFPCLNQIYELHHLQFHPSQCILVLTSYITVVYNTLFNCLFLPPLNTHDVINRETRDLILVESTSTSILYVNKCQNVMCCLIIIRRMAENGFAPP